MPQAFSYVCKSCGYSLRIQIKTVRNVVELLRKGNCFGGVLVKYLGLLAMSKILKTHPKSVQAHKDLILQCLEDKDESIRLRALDLLYGMVGFGVLFCFCANDCFD